MKNGGCLGVRWLDGGVNGRVAQGRAEGVPVQQSC